MKCHIFSIILLTIAFAAAGQKKDIEILKKLNHDWIAAYPTKDTATLARIFANDFILVNPAGDKMTRKDVINNVASPNQNILSTKVDTVEVRLFNNIGIINAKASFTFKEEGKEIKGRTCYMDVYEKRAGRWVAIAAHVTSVK